MQNQDSKKPAIIDKSIQKTEVNLDYIEDIKSISKKDSILQTNQNLVKYDSCNSCGRTNNLSTCSRCKAVKYCDINCQRKDWQKHKKICKKKKKEKKTQRLYEDKKNNNKNKIPESNIIKKDKYKRIESLSYFSSNFGLSYTCPFRYPHLLEYLNDNYTKKNKHLNLNMLIIGTGKFLDDEINEFHYNNILNTSPFLAEIMALFEGDITMLDKNDLEHLTQVLNPQQIFSYKKIWDRNLFSRSLNNTMKEGINSNNNKLSFIQGDASDYKYEADKWDLIFANKVFYYIYMKNIKDNSISSLLKSLKPGGSLYMDANSCSQANLFEILDTKEFNDYSIQTLKSKSTIAELYSFKYNQAIADLDTDDIKIITRKKK